MKAAIKKLIFRALGKDPEAVVACFATGEDELAGRMFDEVRRLVPNRRHVLVRAGDVPGESTWRAYLALRRQFRGLRIGLAPALFTGDRKFRPLRRAAMLLAPTKILAYNARLERHHLRLSAALASFLFLRGVPLDRIFLRPAWLVPWKKERSVYPTGCAEFVGRPTAGRPRVAILTPYFPYPLSHGGAVRVFNLLREMASSFDLYLLAFRDRESGGDLAAVLELCARVTLVDKPRYREPRWSTLLPPEAREFRSPAMFDALRRVRREHNIGVVQVEYTFLAPYRGDVLVEHDVTYSLYRQIFERRRTLAAWWDYWRWRRFETRWARRYRKVAVMSGEDRRLLAIPNAAVIPNGVDLDRFLPEIEKPGARLLFIGSFRHFPNVVAFQFFMERVWPAVSEQLPGARLTVVAGPEPLPHWREHTGAACLPGDARIQILEFVADVRPLYIEANLALAPTLVSAGTNLKVLEAMAMDRAVIATTCGCQGLGLEHGVNVWIADTAEEFAAGVVRLLNDGRLRETIARAGRIQAERKFGWKRIGALQRALLREALGQCEMEIRPATARDLDRISSIQESANEAAQWEPDDYLTYACHVAAQGVVIAGFLVSRKIAEGEREILNVAVHPDYRRCGVATALIRAELERWPGVHFLEVRESNRAARALYEQLGFEEVGMRPGYYDNPPEAGVVMRIFS